MHVCYALDIKFFPVQWSEEAEKCTILVTKSKGCDSCTTMETQKLDIFWRFCIQLEWRFR